MTGVLLSILLSPALASDDAPIDVAAAPGGDAIAVLMAEQTEVFSKKRSAEQVNAEVQTKLDRLAECHQNSRVAHGGELVVTFEVDTRGKLERVSMKDGHTLPWQLKECVSEAFQDLNLGRGDVGFVRVHIDLKDAGLDFVAESRMKLAPETADADEK